MRPRVMISSWPPRLCGIAAFAEEAVEFIRKAYPKQPFYVISHTDGEGEFVKPLIDISKEDWYVPVVEAVKELDPEVIHIQHEYGLYNYINEHSDGDYNRGFIRMLDMLSNYPTIVEPHTIHSRMKSYEEEFVKNLAQKSTLIIFKCNYQKWRLECTFTNYGWGVPTNIIIIPHGARPYKRQHNVDDLKKELGLDEFIGRHIIGLVGWIQSNKRWDIMTSMWEEIYHEIREQTGEEWLLFAAGEMRDPNHKQDYDKYIAGIKLLEASGIAKYYKFIPRGEIYYKVLAVCNFVVLPTLDETQSGTLARIISLNKPFITTAPMEGLTAQTVECEGGLLFTSKENLKKKIIRLATDEKLRIELGSKLENYHNTFTSWEIVAKQYLNAYDISIQRINGGMPVYIRPEFA